MDEILAKYDYVEFDESLNYCEEQGIMYQRDTSVSVEYAEDYYNKYVSYEGSDIANKLNTFRIGLTEKYCNGPLIDIGIGSGEFINNSNMIVFGYDINEVAISYLKDIDLFRDPYMSLDGIEGLTFWDVLEHIPSPYGLLKLVAKGMFVFISIPIFADLTKVKESKHFRKNEHYVYYTENGLIKYMFDSGFRWLETSHGETEAGRDSIGSFVFQKM